MSPPPVPAIDTMMVDDDEQASDEGASLHTRRRSSSTQHNAQPFELVAATADDVSVLWGEFEMVENANSRSPIQVDTPGTVRVSTGPRPSSFDEQPATNTTFVASASHPSTQSASSPSSPTLPPATATSSPSVASV
ncbi:PREDICTED: putative protein TPRXL [Nicotiana attenuata]|uniref:putative protein TPRXL n=1 Tax=Nicotiana attenuata TaxID=49451 RepID=UPI0009054D6B|nr:PREDICTED: putative protein TPRXL [Nicotiana attenuata]